MKSQTDVLLSLVDELMDDIDETISNWANDGAFEFEDADDLQEWHQRIYGRLAKELNTRRMS